MKKYFILSLLALTTALVSAQTTTKQKQKNQKARIEQGVNSGEVTKKEARQLKKQQRNIRKTKQAAKTDGVVTKKEKAVIDRKQKRASKNIYRKKHNNKSVN